jgi:ssDNA-binding Zn-finger/Zn-ribbon topoisomerase 1
MLPLVTHYFHSPDAGEDDPMLRSLHETLEAENPGYLDRVTPEDEQKAHEFIKQLGHKPHDVHANTKESIVPKTAPGLMPTPLGGDPNDPQQMLQNQVAPQGNVPAPPGGQQQVSQCPNCGGVLDGTGACPQCGTGAQAQPNGGIPQPMPGGIPQGFSHTDVLAALVDSANHQGPVTPEQIAAVQQLLIQQHRVEEIPNVPLHPENYVREMAEIQNDPNVAPPVSPEEQTQPPPPQMAPPGAMPVPGMGGGEAGGQPMQPMATTAADNIARKCPKCGSHTTGVAPGSEGLQFCHACGNEWSDGNLVEDEEGTTSRVAADNVARECPNCGSHTTGLADSEGNQFCHACGKEWKDDIVKDPSGTTARVAAPHDGVPNPIDTPAADRSDRRNPDAEEDSSLSWKDTDGLPLQPGKEYEMVNPSYELPDMIRIDRVKPDGLDVTLVGTFANDPNAMQAPTEITLEDMKLHGITFTPAISQEDRGNEPPPGTAAPGEPPRPQTTDEHENSFPQQSSIHKAGNDYCPQCGDKAVVSSMNSPVELSNECYKCAHTWTSAYENVISDTNAASRDWINSDSGGDDFFGEMERARAVSASAGMGSRNIQSIAAGDERSQQIKAYLAQEAIERQERTAGRHFTPKEQRELIDEDGVARNSNLLNLQGTHYRTRDDFSGKANGSNVPDDHLALGI